MVGVEAAKEVVVVVVVVVEEEEEEEEDVEDLAGWDWVGKNHFHILILEFNRLPSVSNHIKSFLKLPSLRRSFRVVVLSVHPLGNDSLVVLFSAVFA